MCHISDHESRISLFLDTNASIQKKNWPTSHFFLRSNFSQIIQSCMEKSFSKVFIRRWNWFFYVLKSTPQEKCPYLEFFLVCIFPHLEWIRRFIKWIFVFSPNAGKCTPEKLRIRTIFTQYNAEPSMGLVSSTY